MPTKTKVKEKKISKTEWEGKRFTPCTCGNCGLIWDTKHDISIAWFTGPDKKEEVPLPRELQQKYMAVFCKAMNEYVEKHDDGI